MSEKVKLRREKAEDEGKSWRKADTHRGISRFVVERRAPLLAHVFVKSRSFLNAQPQKQPTKMQKAAADVGGRAQNL